jgi:hypothetical protein
MPTDIVDPSQLSDRREWKELVEAFDHYVERAHAFLTSDIDKVELIRRALHNFYARPLAVELFQNLEQKQLQALFPDMVALAITSDGMPNLLHDAIIHYLDKDWVIRHIHAVAMPYLADTTEYAETSALMKIYDRLSPDLVRELATWAASSPHPEIREYGLGWLSEALPYRATLLSPGDETAS